MSHQLPVIEFRKVLCVDPCDPKGLKTRRVCLLVQSDPCSLRNAKVEISQPSAWKSEPKLVNPVRLVDSIETDTIVQEIHVIDPAFGNQLLQYITAREPIKPGMEIPEGNISTDSNLVGSLWTRALRAPDYEGASAIPDASKNFGLPRDEVYMDGSRAEFVASYNNKYPVQEEVLADDIPTYCDCQVKGDNNNDRGEMIQCANGERWCLKEWYHLSCIGMAKEAVPPGDIDWYCKDCIKDRIGNLKKTNYVPYKHEEAAVTPNAPKLRIPNRNNGKKKGERIRHPQAKAAVEKAKERFGGMLGDEELEEISDLPSPSCGLSSPPQLADE